VVDFTEEDCPLNMAVVGRNLDGSFKCSSSVCAACPELCLEYDCGEPDLIGGCKPKPVGEQGLLACQQCDGSSLDPEFVPNNNQDIDGLNLCNSACSACQDGVCDSADINTDPGGQCPYDIQYQIGGDPNYCQQRERDGFCDGVGSCNDYSSWQNINENQVCSSNAPHCSGNTYYAGYTCAGGTCNQDYNDIGCCQCSKCPSGSYCRQSDHTCVVLPLCTQCSVGFGYVNAADDSRCGTIDCDGLNSYYTTGSNGPNVTETCIYRNYVDITTNRCEGFNNCKDPNSSDCTVYNNNTIASCGFCKYLTGGSCNSGASCTTYPYGTNCGSGWCIGTFCRGNSTGIYCYAKPFGFLNCNNICASHGGSCLVSYQVGSCGTSISFCTDIFVSSCLCQIGAE
jgi:hypothetical protein